MDVIVSDFDDTLFKRNYGLIGPVVDYLEQKGLPIYIVTYRAQNQLNFIIDTLSATKLKIVGFGFAESRKKEAFKKVELIQNVRFFYNVVEVLDDDEQVVLALRQHGIKANRA